MGNSQQKQLKKAYDIMQDVKEFTDAPDDLAKLRGLCNKYFNSDKTEKEKMKIAALIQLHLLDMDNEEK